MNFDEQPETTYAYKGVLRTEDIREIIETLETFNPETPVCWAKKNMLASRGVWVRLGTYARKSGSFVDGQDLTLYVDSFYEYDESPKGRHAGVELNHGTFEVPDGAQTASTVDELLEALVILDSPEDDADADESAAEGAPGSASAVERDPEGESAAGSDAGDAAKGDAEGECDAAVATREGVTPAAGEPEAAEGNAVGTEDAEEGKTEGASTEVEAAAADNPRTSAAVPATPGAENVNPATNALISDADAESASEAAAEQDADVEASAAGPIELNNLAQRILVQPDADPLRKHSLSIGWKLMHYRAADGSALIVFD